MDSENGRDLKTTEAKVKKAWKTPELIHARTEETETGLSQETDPLQLHKAS